MRLDIDTFGEEQVSRELLRFSDKLEDSKPAFTEIAEKVAAFELRQFDTQGASGSGGWAPLAASTKANKARRGLDPRILRATEALRSSLVSVGGSGNVTHILDDSLTFGTKVPYAMFHQKGTSRMPRRKVLELSETDRRSVVRTLQRFYVKGLT